MIRKRSHTGVANLASMTRLLMNMKWCLSLIIIVLVTALVPARADETEDQYLRIYNVIEQADSLSKSGQNDAARVKYQQAYKELLAIQRSRPSWNTKTVSFRLRYLDERIAALSQPAPISAAKSEGSPDKKAASAAGPQVKLLEAGAEPRKAFRWHAKPGDKQTGTITLKISLDMGLGQPMKLPAMNMTMEFTVKSVSPNGDISYESTTKDATVAEDADTMPQIAEAMKASINTLKGVSGSSTISARGINLRTEMKIPPGADPQTRQSIEQTKESLSSMAVPLPEEAIGPGAKWEVKQQVKSEGMTIDQTTTCELVSVEGDRLNLKSSIAQHAANQKVQNPAMPALKLDLKKLTGSGSGNVTIDLAQIFPVDGSFDQHSERELAMDSAAGGQTINMKTDVNIRLESK
jgi:hypothetical protein